MDTNEIVELFHSSLSQNDISKHLGISVKSIRKIWRENFTTNQIAERNNKIKQAV